MLKAYRRNDYISVFPEFGDNSLAASDSLTSVIQNSHPNATTAD